MERGAGGRGAGTERGAGGYEIGCNAEQWRHSGEAWEDRPGVTPSRG